MSEPFFSVFQYSWVRFSKYSVSPDESSPRETKEVISSALLEELLNLGKTTPCGVESTLSLIWADAIWAASYLVIKPFTKSRT